MTVHVPVMSQEVLEALAIKPGSTVADLTAGGGGHLRLMAEAVGPTGLVLALDQDPRAHELDAAGGVAAEFPQVKLFKMRFSELPSLVGGELLKLDALLADLGVSSYQLDTPGRGLSFMREGPLDMRMDPSSGVSAYELIRESSETKLADLIYTLGEERLSRRIARAIKSQKFLENSTLALAHIVARACGAKRGRIHPATRTFQALRIAVNHELEELQNLLGCLEGCMALGSRVALISFHSLEDRLVKNFFKNKPEFWKVLSRKPITASLSEISENPRARSAKLRSAERINV